MYIGIMGSEAAEKVLLYIANYGDGYAKAISEVFGLSLSQVQRQLNKFEREGLLVSQVVGKTRLFKFNPRYALKKELLVLLNKALSILPKEVTQKYFRKRKRPRRAGKPI